MSKLRIERSIRDRARACARAVDDTLLHWIGVAIAKAERGELDVEITPNSQNSTRGTTVIDVPFYNGGGPRLRATILAAVEFAERRNPPPFVTTARPGKDYFL